MADSESEKFVTPRHPTLGDAAGRHVPDLPGDAAQVTRPHVTPLMENASIGRGTSRLLITGFLLMTVFPAIWALASQLRTGSSLAVMLHHPTSQNVDTFSGQMLEQSPCNKFLKRTWGLEYARASGDPLGRVMIGHDGWLFYREDYEVCAGYLALTDSLPRAVSTTVQYSRDLATRGIHLVVLPIPPKTAIVPDKLLRDYPIAMGPALNPDYGRWLAMVRSQGVHVVDLTDDFWQMSRDGQMPYLPQDTHWTPQGMERAAGLVAKQIQPFLGDYSKYNYTTKSIPYVSQGDLVELMGAWGDTKSWPPARVPMTGVLEDGKPLEAGDEATVLLLGDSYTLAYADPETMPVPGGLSQHLMLNLRTPVQSIAGRGSHFAGSRETLVNHPEALKNKKVVVWEFTGRGLPSAMVPLPSEIKRP